MTSTVPPGRSLSALQPGHFVPVYYQPIPPGQKPDQQARTKNVDEGQVDSGHLWGTTQSVR
jgi:hypothetical protein